MPATVRQLMESVRKWSGKGAERNAQIEVDRAKGEVVDLDRQLRRVCEPYPRRAA
jgi:hypothetical protein